MTRILSKGVYSGKLVVSKSCNRTGFGRFNGNNRSGPGRIYGIQRKITIFRYRDLALLPYCKLFSYGIGGKTLKWINVFLCYRLQSVVVNGVKSDWTPVVSGVSLDGHGNGGRSMKISDKRCHRSNFVIFTLIFCQKPLDQ